MSTYRNWNNALWKYFFPNGNEDAILYLDDNILRIIAEKERLNCDEPASNDFLQKTLINSADLLQQFRNDFGDWTGERRCPGANRWDNLVQFLLNTREQIGGAPAYFAMLCAIMYLASSKGADHTRMTTLARQYLGEGYIGRNPGE